MTKTVGGSRAIAAAQARYADTVSARVRSALVDWSAEGHDPSELGDANELADRLIATLPFASSPIENVTGPFYDTGGLTSWLGVSRQALDSRVRALSILGLPVEVGPRVYPAWQFTAEGSVIAGLSDVLHALAPGDPNPWTWALWLCSRSPDAWDGLTAWQWLADGRDPEPLLVEARADAARWAA